MAEIFISYARAQAATAQAVAAALVAQGWRAWWDRELPPHRTFADVIEERLTQSQAVLVLWSQEAVASQWVRAEADMARNLGKLVQISLDGVKPPLPFNQIHCEAVGWPPDIDSVGWRKVLTSLAEFAGGATTPETGAEPAAVSRATNALLAVLPFANLSNDPEMEYFSDGISEDILRAIGSDGYIPVAGRLSTFRFRAGDRSLSRIVGEIGASHVLDGSVRRMANRLRVSVSLTACADGEILWSDRFDREIADVFDLQDEISGAIAAALKLKLAPKIRPSRIDPAAYDLFLRAQAVGSAPMEAQGRAHLLEAVVARAPRFAAAWAGLAMAIATDMRFRDGGRHISSLRPSAIAAAERAIEIDPQSATARVALSMCEPTAAHARRETLLAEALALQPDDVDVLKAAGDFRQAVGRVREALTFFSRACFLDPLNEAAAHNNAWALFDTGYTEAARQAFDIGRERNPEFSWWTASPLIGFTMIGDWDEVDRLLAVPVDWTRPDLASVRTASLAIREPTPQRLQPWIDRAERTLASRGTIPLSILAWLSAAGQSTLVQDYIQRASFEALFVADGLPLEALIRLEMLYGRGTEGLRRDRSFVHLCAKLGLVQYWFESEHWPDCIHELKLYYDFRAEAEAFVR